MKKLIVVLIGAFGLSIFAPLYALPVDNLVIVQVAEIPVLLPEDIMPVDTGVGPVASENLPRYQYVPSDWHTARYYEAAPPGWRILQNAGATVNGFKDVPFKPLE